MKFKLSIVAATSALLMGCVSSSAVNQASTKLLSASHGWGAVPAELKQSCVRIQALNEFANCDTVNAGADALGETTKVLVAYFTAMQKASSGDTYKVTGLDDVGTALGKVKNIKPEETKAVLDFVQLLSNWATESERQQALTMLIDAAPQAQRILIILQTRVIVSAELEADVEKKALGLTYREYITRGSTVEGKLPEDCSLGARPRDYTDGAQFLIAQEYCRQLNAFISKRQIIAQYKTSLESSSKVLQTLQENRSRLKEKALLKIIADNLRDLQEKTDALEVALVRGGE